MLLPRKQRSREGNVSGDQAVHRRLVAILGGQADHAGIAAPLQLGHHARPGGQALPPARSSSGASRRTRPRGRWCAARSAFFRLTMRRCDQMTSSACPGPPFSASWAASHTAATGAGRSSPAGAQPHGVGDKAVAMVLHADRHAVALQQRQQRVVFAPQPLLGLGVALVRADVRHDAQDRARPPRRRRDGAPHRPGRPR